MLVMSCVQPGTVSTISASPPAVRKSCVSPVCDVAEAEARLALDDQELLGLGVVIVPAARDARVRGEVGELAAVGRLQHLDEHAARVAVPRHGVGERFRRQIADVGGVQRADQAGADPLGHQRLAAVRESRGSCRATSPTVVCILRRDVAKPSAPRRHRRRPASAMKRVDHVVDIDQRERRRRIVDLIGRPRAMLWQKVATAEL